MGTGAGRYTGEEFNATSPLRRDTILIPAFSWVVLRYVTDNREYSLSLSVYLKLRDAQLLYLSPTRRLPKRVYGRSTATLLGIWRPDC